MQRPAVLVFAGNDPSGGAGLAADIAAISAQGVHALPVATCLTVQDNNCVAEIHPVNPDLVRKQAQMLAEKISFKAVKIGIVGSHANALAIVELIRQWRIDQPNLPVILDPVLASGRGNVVSVDDACASLTKLIGLATLITPNLPEAIALCAGEKETLMQAKKLLMLGAQHVLIKGGHDVKAHISNRWYSRDISTQEIRSHAWITQRVSGEFHGSGCTLAAAIAGLLVTGQDMFQAIERGLFYTAQAIESSYVIAAGQRIPQRFFLERK